MEQENMEGSAIRNEGLAQGKPVSDRAKCRQTGVAMDALARLPEHTLVDEAKLAELLAVKRRTVRRMVARYELPPALSFAGRSTWTVGLVLRWFITRAEKATEEAERKAQQFRKLGS